jgi:hypothetical protein
LRRAARVITYAHEFVHSDPVERDPASKDFGSAREKKNVTHADRFEKAPPRAAVFFGVFSGTQPQGDGHE